MTNSPDRPEAREAEIRARLDAATPGPWQACTWDPMERPHVHKDPPNQRICRPPDLPLTKADAEFIAHAPEDISHLLDANERLRALALVRPRAAPVGSSPAARDKVDALHAKLARANERITELENELSEPSTAAIRAAADTRSRRERGVRVDEWVGGIESQAAYERAVACDLRAAYVVDRVARPEEPAPRTQCGMWSCQLPKGHDGLHLVSEEPAPRE